MFRTVWNNTLYGTSCGTSYYCIFRFASLIICLYKYIYIYILNVQLQWWSAIAIECFRAAYFCFVLSVGVVRLRAWGTRYDLNAISGSFSKPPSPPLKKPKMLLLPMRKSAMPCWASLTACRAREKNIGFVHHIFSSFLWSVRCVCTCAIQPIYIL